MAAPIDKAVPEWLDDVAQNESRKLQQPRPVPDWLNDVQQSEKLRHPAALAAIPLDWLEDIRQIEESLRLRPSPATDPLLAATALIAPPPVRLRSALPAHRLRGGPDTRIYDPETGQIFDPVAYALWQKAEAQRRKSALPTEPALSVAEAFLEAQRALQEWVDAEANKGLVASGGMEDIRQCPAVQDVLLRYAGYGPVMQEKLCRRLGLLVDNRRRFFKAF